MKELLTDTEIILLKGMLKLINITEFYQEKEEGKPEELRKKGLNVSEDKLSLLKKNTTFTDDTAKKTGKMIDGSFRGVKLPLSYRQLDDDIQYMLKMMEKIDKVFKIKTALKMFFEEEESNE